MSNALYLEDSYLQEFEGEVVKVTDGKFIILDKTAFYPNAGGQPFDTGVLISKSDSKLFNVVFVGKFNGEISHEIENTSENPLSIGDKITGKINWQRRYAHMKAHTCAHILAESLFRNSGALTTGNQLSGEESRIDSNFEYSPELIEKVFSEANAVLRRNLDVMTQVLKREDAEKIQNMTKLAKGLPPEIREVRIVSIGDYDKQADGGTHVKNTSEIESIEFLRYNSKGKDNKRIYFKVN